MEEIKKILILTNYYEEGPSSRYRSFNYKNYFERNGLKVEYCPLFFNGYVNNLYLKKKNKILLKVLDILKRIIYIIRNKKKYNHIIIETELIKFLPFFIEKFLLKETSYSLDYDDNPNLTYKKNRILDIVYGKKIEKLSKEASFVTVGNKWYFEEINSENLEYLPTVIDLKKYFVLKKNNQKIITLVWIGSPSTEKYLDILEEPLKKLSKKYKIQLKIIGSNKKLKDVEVVNIKWCKETEILEIAKSDIGVMPLESTDWEKGKCGFKLIQYMACGLPVIATNSPANLEIINKNGFIINKLHEWEEKLEILIRDKTLRKKLGEKSREIIKNKYTYQVWGDRYSNKIKKTINNLRKDEI